MKLSAKGILKGIIYIVLALVVIMVLAVVALVTLVEPNDYRDDISRIAKESAGVELTLGGDLSWRFYPVLGFGANDVTLALRSGEPALMQLDELALGLKILPLLSKQIEIDELQIGGLKANLIVDENGESNWQLAADNSATTADTSKNDKPAGIPAELESLFIPLVGIHNSTITYQDKASGADYTLDLPLLQLKHVNLKEPFSMQMEARIKDQAGLDVSSKLESQVYANLSSGQFGLSEMQLDAEVAGIFEKTVTVDVQGDIQFDQQQDQATVSLQRVQFANLIAQLQLLATKVSTEPVFSGQLESEPFNAKVLMTALGIAVPQTQKTAAMSRVQIKTGFSGSPAAVSLKPLTVKLDSSTLSGELAVTDVTKQIMRFVMQLDHINIDEYLPPPVDESEVKAVVKVKGGVDTDLIPVELLRTLNVKGTFKAGEVIVSSIPIKNIAVNIQSIDGELKISDIKASLMQGSLAGSVGLDTRPAQPKITVDVGLENIEIGDALQPFVPVQLVTGRTSMKIDTATQGNDIDTLIKQALGEINLNMANTILHGVNINQVALDAVKSKLGDFSALLPDYQEKLPKELKRDTQINDLLATMKLEGGHLIMPTLKTNTSEGQLTASGDIDLLNMGFDYHFGVVLAALEDNKYLKGARWPVRCKGGVDTPVMDWCRPDSKAVNNVLEHAAEQALRDKAAQKLGEKLGVKNADEAAAKQQLQKKTKEAEDRAKQKLDEKLKKLFGD
ncbi:MAG: AsmA family protein [Spongiibacteraceae bacterium]